MEPPNISLLFLVLFSSSAAAHEGQALGIALTTQRPSAAIAAGLGQLSGADHIFSGLLHKHLVCFSCRQRAGNAIGYKSGELHHTQGKNSSTHTVTLVHTLESLMDSMANKDKQIT